MRQNKELHPLMSWGQLKEYFKDKFPEELRFRREDDLTYLEFSRLLVLEFGGPEKARIYWIAQIDEFGDDYIDGLGHAYVVPNGLRSRHLAYNNFISRFPGYCILGIRSVEYVRRVGIDVTDVIFACPWTRIDVYKNRDPHDGFERYRNLIHPGHPQFNDFRSHLKKLGIES